MDQLVGQRFHLENTDYTIVDVRNIQGDTLVYAEPVSKAQGPGRAAFRYVDIEAHLNKTNADVA